MDEATKELIQIIKDGIKHTPPEKQHYSWQEDLDALTSGRAVAVKHETGYTVVFKDQN